MFNALKRAWQREPIRVANAGAALLELILIALVAFHVPITTDQLAALTGLIIGIGQFAATAIGRSQVAPMAHVKELKSRDETDPSRSNPSRKDPSWRDRSL